MSLKDLRQTGTLVGGAEVDGVLHRDFELRLPTVQDNIDAVDEVGSTNGVALSAAIIARQLTRLGSLKADQINFDLIVQLHPCDYNQLEAAAGDLEKKRIAASKPAETGSASGSVSSGSA
jgi:hypothetical protein